MTAPDPTHRLPDPSAYDSVVDAYLAGYDQAIADLALVGLEYRNQLPLFALVNALIERLRGKRRSL